MTIDILRNRSKEDLAGNIKFIFERLANPNNNPLDMERRDPANSNNKLSDLSDDSEKNRIKEKAKIAANASYLSEVFAR
ncbi:MAG: hypothetical protein LBM19_03900 [Holosporales bacterium]|nr:hypothetical protein [Holosporales bacterium]